MEELFETQDKGMHDGACSAVTCQIFWAEPPVAKFKHELQKNILFATLPPSLPNVEIYFPPFYHLHEANTILLDSSPRPPDVPVHLVADR